MKTIVIIIALLFIIAVVVFILGNREEKLSEDFIKGFENIESYCGYLETKFGIDTEILKQDDDVVVVYSGQESALLDRVTTDFEKDYIKKYDNEVKFIKYRNYGMA